MDTPTDTTPVAPAVLQQFERKKMQMLVLGLIFDLIGVLSYAVPGLGETADIAWGPIAGILYFAMYRGILGAVGGSFTMLEEVAPFTDVIPTFTLTWLYLYQINGEKTFQSYVKGSTVPIEAEDIQ